MILLPTRMPTPLSTTSHQPGSIHDAAVARAIVHLAREWQAPPSLDELAADAGLSPAHFQRAFRGRVGVSPKRFAQHLTLTHAKRLLERRRSLLDASLDAGLSGPSRLHDLFVACEAMTPGEYKARGRDLVIRWGIHPSPIGPCLLGATDRGICWLSFGDTAQGLAELKHDWSAATLVEAPDETASLAAQLFPADPRNTGPISVLLRGTNFQMQVWRALLRIQPGSVATYADVAAGIDAPTAVRAVGAACGANRVSWLIPCHRVIGATGAITGYRWGDTSKRALLAREAALS